MSISKKYYKGYNSHGDRVYALAHSELVKDHFDYLDGTAGHQYEVRTLDRSAVKFYKDENDLESAGIKLEREISENEFDTYRYVGLLLDELFLRGYTGGFPRKSNIRVAVSGLTYSTTTMIREII